MPEQTIRLRPDPNPVIEANLVAYEALSHEKLYNVTYPEWDGEPFVGSTDNKEFAEKCEELFNWPFTQDTEECSKTSKIKNDTDSRTEPVPGDKKPGVFKKCRWVNPPNDFKGAAGVDVEGFKRAWVQWGLWLAFQMRELCLPDGKTGSLEDCQIPQERARSILDTLTEGDDKRRMYMRHMFHKGEMQWLKKNAGEAAEVGQIIGPNIYAIDWTMRWKFAASTNNFCSMEWEKP